MLNFQTRRQMALSQANERRNESRKRVVVTKDCSQKITKQETKDTTKDNPRHIAVRINAKIDGPRPGLALRKRNEEPKRAPLRALLPAKSTIENPTKPSQAAKANPVPVNPILPLKPAVLATRTKCTSTQSLSRSTSTPELSRALPRVSRHRSSSLDRTRKALPDVVATATRRPMRDLTKSIAISPIPVTPMRPDVFVDPDMGNDDPQLCSEYAKDIYSHWLDVERRDVYLIGSEFMATVFFVRPSHRAVLIDWLFQLQPKFRFLNETMYLCVDILDRVLQVEPRIPKSKLQLVGVTALFIATKFEEIYPPALSDLIYMTDNTYTPEQVLAKEVEIHRKLGYQYNRPYCITFLRRYSTIMDTTTGTHSLAKYILELSLLDHQCSSINPSKKAAAALLLSSHILAPHKPPCRIWDENMAYHSKYRVRDIQNTKVKLKKAVQEGHNSPKTTTIRKKYRGSVLSNAATLRALDRL